ncbi:inositol-tetrakisphosphate 1-kinase-like [Argiope bruennichi]|uniref:Inositol-tetrakisphosphate 1-kinase like protein n=1 Tax=Argiope bruennichi TaxID=94029 RepID=A0A8T0EUJ5_ARGBR|nr:inositol-tetrakisphosphate 1-kinase-like [Argiope bruennichi]KAF8777699.1 Inositol-tetrakisphosphate 1-kinase like protein [Argiope bruennichi]
MSDSPLRRVGYWWSEKKSRKLNAEELTAVCRAAGLELVKLDMNRSFDEQGPFSAIVHKMSDILVQAKKGDPQAKAVCEAIQDYIDAHPTMAVIDPLENVEKVLGRYEQYRIVNESEICDEGDIFIPAFVELTSMNVQENLTKMKSAGVDFPLVCKPTMAHGSTRSHQMCIIFNEEGLNDITPPCVVQKFINHNAVLYKLFIIGQEYFVIERPSLKNFSACDQKTIFFDSNEISKPNSVSELTSLDDNESYTPTVWPEQKKMDNIVRVLHKYLGLDLLGIDVVIDNRTGHYAIIDMNVFPGYYEADNFYHLLTNLVLNKIHWKESGMVEEPYKPKLIDHLSTPVLKMEESNKKSTDVFNFWKDVKPKIMDPHATDSIHPVKQTLNVSDPPEAVQCIADKHLHDVQNEMLLFQKQNDVQEDSGVETSDSCDEKKNKICHRTVKHQHSKKYASNCTSLKEMR